MTLEPPHFINVNRKFGGSVSGYIVGRSLHVVLVRSFDGFTPSGFVAVRRSDVNELLINEKWTAMIAAEGHAPLADERPVVLLESFDELLMSLHRRQRNLMIECEDCGEAPESGLHVGRIIALAQDHLDFAWFGTDGRWFDGSYAIPFNSITRIEFDTPYVDTFSKYLGECPGQVDLE